MTDDRIEAGDTPPTVEVRVFRHGQVVHRELVESEEQAGLVVDEWSELEGVRCEADDLTVVHEPGQVLEPAPADLLDEDYPATASDDRF